MELDRRKFLRAAGVSLALPCLDAFQPTRAFGAPAVNPPRRMVCICAPLGWHPPDFFPEKAGKNYELSSHLEVLKDFRSDFTVISGLSRAGMSPGFAHQASASFLTGIPGAGRPGFRNAISVDQFAAMHIGGKTRFPSLTLSGEGAGLSWTRTGALVPSATSPSKVFAKLFLDGSAEELRSQVTRLEDGRSILDDVRGQANSLRSKLGSDDRDKLDEYMTSVRELEQRLARDEAWAKTPKPKVKVEPLKDIPNVADIIGRSKLMFDLTHLALQTDSTRLITIMLAGSTFAPPIQGVTLGHHDLSHHGKDPGKLAQLKIVETETLKTVRDLLTKLKQTREDGASLLDRTMVFLGSNLGDASSHSVKNLPVLLAGGGFKHDQHLAFDPQNPPPCATFTSACCSDWASRRTSSVLVRERSRAWKVLKPEYPSCLKRREFHANTDSDRSRGDSGDCRGREAGAVGLSEPSEGRGQATRPGDRRRDGKVPRDSRRNDGRHKLPVADGLRDEPGRGHRADLAVEPRRADGECGPDRLGRSLGLQRAE
jgi:Protein of unknown function (DUF1552)